MTEDLQPELGSGALREALWWSDMCGHAEFCSGNDKECRACQRLAALSLSSPIESLTCTCNDSSNEHGCPIHGEFYASNMGAQASSEIRKRPNLLSSIPLATGRDSAASGWTVDPAFLLEVRELLSGDERPDLEAIEAVVLALNKLQTRRALAPSRQGAGG